MLRDVCTNALGEDISICPCQHNLVRRAVGCLLCPHLVKFKQHVNGTVEYLVEQTRCVVVAACLPVSQVLCFILVCVDFVPCSFLLVRANIVLLFAET